MLFGDLPNVHKVRKSSVKCRTVYKTRFVHHIAWEPLVFLAMTADLHSRLTEKAELATRRKKGSLFRNQMNLFRDWNALSVVLWSTSLLALISSAREILPEGKEGEEKLMKPKEIFKEIFEAVESSAQL